jgi:thioesterase domain-containing protein
MSYDGYTHILSREGRNMPSPVSADTSSECLIAVQPTGEDPPFFVVHGIHCDISFARLLAAQFQPPHRVYGLRGRGLDGRRPPLATFEAMAAEYISALCRIEPEGPYALVGLCAGGHLAMEMAHQLMAAGFEVAHLFLVLTPPRLDPATIEWVTEKAVEMAERNLETHPWARRNLAGATASVRAFGAAYLAYKPKYYPGKVQIYGTSEGLERALDPEGGWPKLVPRGTRLRVVARAYENLIQPRILRDIAQHMRQQLSG